MKPYPAQGYKNKFTFSRVSFQKTGSRIYLNQIYFCTLIQKDRMFFTILNQIGLIKNKS